MLGYPKTLAASLALALAWTLALPDFTLAQRVRGREGDSDDRRLEETDEERRPSKGVRFGSKGERKGDRRQGDRGDRRDDSRRDDSRGVRRDDSRGVRRDDSRGVRRDDSQGERQEWPAEERRSPPGAVTMRESPPRDILVYVDGAGRMTDERGRPVDRMGRRLDSNGRPVFNNQPDGRVVFVYPDGRRSDRYHSEDPARPRRRRFSFCRPDGTPRWRGESRRFTYGIVGEYSRWRGGTGGVYGLGVLGLFSYVDERLKASLIINPGLTRRELERKAVEIVGDYVERNVTMIAMRDGEFYVQFRTGMQGDVSLDGESFERTPVTERGADTFLADLERSPDKVPASSGKPRQPAAQQ
ncbi:MAG: hypothetical protein LBG06_02265 [Deltaproteobacteria bacterium]|jgi:hypothetical protein|nr:hypothetical protein [Deltaproteobacteria bacterium]